MYFYLPVLLITQEFCYHTTYCIVNYIQATVEMQLVFGDWKVVTDSFTAFSWSGEDKSLVFS